MRFWALAFFGSMLAAQTPATLVSVTAVRHWSSKDSTRVAVEVSGEFQFRSDRLHNPERVYYDIVDAVPHFGPKRYYKEDVDDPLLKRIRVAETREGVTRVVLDLAESVEVSVSQLASPNRLIVELRTASKKGPATPAEPAPVTPVAAPQAAPKTEAPKPTPPPAKEPPVVKAEALARTTAEPPHVQPAEPPRTAATEKTAPPPPTEKPAPEKAVVEHHAAEPPRTAATEKTPPPPSIEKPAAEKPVEEAIAPKPAPDAAPAETGKAAHRTSQGEASLVRTLGLKINRVVIDPGHGGHDNGTEGTKGLLEKDLVLDVAKRVGKLIEERMQAEVIYTRTDDTFIPLEGRTALANEKKADLFLSVHANFSPAAPKVSGVETYYLNFTESKDALDLAMRENATSAKSVFDLKDIIQKITAHDKAEESREFASRVQAALYAFSLRNFPAERNRGVRKAPFVVLIGANMPSVLAEIGFLSNPREEGLLKKPDYRQKLAEALFRGVQRYAESLSHFQVAQNK